MTYVHRPAKRFTSQQLTWLLIIIAALVVLIGGWTMYRQRHTDSGVKSAASTPTFKAANSYAKIYYVNPGGSDANKGTSAQSPMQTINKALSFAGPGDTIQLADGDYFQSVSSVKDGSQQSPITIHGSRKAVIRGDDKQWRVISISNNYISLDGFTVDGQSKADAKAKDDFRNKLIYALGTKPQQGVEGLKIHDMLVQNAGDECIRLRYFAQHNEISNTTVRNCGIYDFRFNATKNKNGEGIYVGTAPTQRDNGINPTNDPDQSSNNYIHDNDIETHGNECVDIKSGSTDNIVEKNTCRYQMDSESAGFDARGDNNTFRFNTVSDNQGAGFRLGDDNAGTGVRNDVYQNTIKDNKQGAVKIRQMPQGTICGNTLSNNNDDQNKRSLGIDPASACN